MSSATTITREPEIDPLRAALAEAIEKMKAAREKVAKHTTAVGRARGMLQGAETAAERAKGAVVKARKRHAELIAEAAGAGSALPRAEAIRQARQHERDCLDEVEAAQDAVARVKADVAEVAGQASMAQHAVIIKVNEVVAPEATSALAQMRRLRSLYFEMHGKLEALLEPDEHIELPFPGPVGAADARDKSLAAVRWEATNVIANRPGADDAELTIMERAAGSWRSWRRSLQSDPNAEPPLPLQCER